MKTWSVSGGFAVGDTVDVRDVRTSSVDKDVHYGVGTDVRNNTMPVGDTYSEQWRVARDLPTYRTDMETKHSMKQLSEVTIDLKLNICKNDGQSTLHTQVRLIT